MSIFTLQSVQKHLGMKVILNSASFSFEAADKVGLIGTNGSGKSTLLKMIAGIEHIDAGQITVNNGVRIAYLPQDPELDESRTVLEQVFSDSSEQISLVREYEDISDRLSHAEAGESAQLSARLADLMPRMEANGAWELENNAKIILTKLGVEDIHAPIAALSGGYRKRIALASALLSSPDVLLMDEPTNHLDAFSVEWLQGYLNRFRGALLLITHDRYFLDQVTNRIIEIDRGDLFTYAGNYSYYLEKKALAEEAAISTQRKHQGVLRRELEWLRRGPKARSTKQKARIDRAHALRDQEFKQVKGKVEIATAGRRIGKKVIELEGVTKSYAGRVLIENFTYKFTPEDRIGIIGPNGSGKSTLMNIITGRVPPDSGEVELGATVEIGYFDQHSEAMALARSEDQRVIDYIKEVADFVKIADGTLITASQMLERFLFPGSQQYVPLANLSGGEKRRLFLLRILMGAPNVLILDEPTNDLDVQTLSVLEEYLEDFTGCVISVSHDRYFLDRVVDSIFAFEPGGELRQYPGNYSLYLDFKEREALEAAKAVAPKPQRATQVAVASPPVVGTRKLSSKEKRELQTLETKIAEMEAKRDAMEAKLATLSTDFSAANTLYEQMGELTHALDTATERWLALAELEA